MHSNELRIEVARLLGLGLRDREIADRTGIPRSSVATWRRKGIPTRRRVRPPDPNWRPPSSTVYSYLLGLYLGDGCLSVWGNHAELHICLDAAYPGIVAEASVSITTTMPGTRIHHVFRPGMIVVQSWSPDWLAAFPQHGPGKKHERRIELVDWQREITRAHPRELIRGLIHSDGCRTVNRFAVDLPRGGRRTYAYARYFFSNLSTDIRRIFTDHCDLLGIRWTLSNPRNVSVSHRRSVALLDEFVGAKA
jgi:hypothetical protein